MTLPEDMVDEDLPPKKKAKTSKAKGPPPRPEDLEPGTPVLYWDGWRGRIHDAFEAVDQFWVTDEESGEVVRDEAGKIVDFASSDLQLVGASAAPAEAMADAAAEASTSLKGGLVLLGTEDQMLKILEHFGTPSYEERQNPQQLLAIPCAHCEADQLLRLATEGVDDGLREFGQRLREDINVAVRVYNMKQVVRKLAPDLVRLKDYYCLASVQLPFSWQDIEDAPSKEVAYERKDVWNQIDLCASATGEVDSSLEDTPLMAARSALGTNCGIELSDVLWQKEVQVRLRKMLNVEVLPLESTDGMGVETFTIIIPKDAMVTTIKGVLCFAEAPGADYTKSDVSVGQKSTAEGLKDKARASQETKVQGKTIREWEREQDQFADEPKLPPGWLRIKSRGSGKVYYWNKDTQKATFDNPGAPVAKKPQAEAPLPSGWTKHVSKSTGKVYYFNAGRNKSAYERPTA